MKITGHRIKEAIEAWKIKRELAADAFGKALFSFEGEKKMPADAFFAEYDEAEDAIVKLQAAQAEYNLHVTLDASGENYTLIEAVKRVGVLTRYIKVWKEALKAQAVETSRWERQRNFVRKQDDQIAEKTITDERCREMVTKLSQQKNALQGAVAVANATPVEIVLDENLLR
jgi:hypothetical protein